MPEEPRIVSNVRDRAVFFRSPDLATLRVTGADRKSWLNGLVTCDVAKVAPGRALYGLAVSKVGRILADVLVVDAGDALLVGVPRDREAALREHLERFLMMEDAALDSATADFAWVHAHGARARELVDAAAAPSGARTAEHDPTRLGGAIAVVPVTSLDAFAAALADAGATRGTDAEWEALRIARAVARFGADFDERSYPQEASLEDVAVSFSKGCYLGQEVVCRLQMRGHVTKKLVPLAIEGDAAPEPGAPVSDASGEPVGAVSSVVGADGGALALASVKLASAAPGTALSAGGHAARVLAIGP